MAKTDVTTKTLEWNDFLGKPDQQTIEAIYKHADDTSRRARDWYWQSIRYKRHISVAVRVVTFGLVVLGAVLPLVAAVAGKPEHRLVLTQVGIIGIAIAGLAQLLDNSFGFSSGWLRYVTTVTAMERLTLQFQLDWASYCIGKPALLGNDKQALFDLAKAFELEIDKKRSDETDAWVAEFNKGQAALNEVIKAQRDLTEKAAALAKSEVDARAQSARTGAIELKILQSGTAKPITVFLDNREGVTFEGPSWAAVGLDPGQHQVRVRLGGEDGPTLTRVATVPSGGVDKLEVEFK